MNEHVVLSSAPLMTFNMTLTFFVDTSLLLHLDTVRQHHERVFLCGTAAGALLISVAR